MIATVFNTIIYNPLYNGLVYLVGIIPSHDVGIAVVILTIIVRIIIYPLSRRAVQAQLDMKKVAPEVTKIRDKYKDDKQGESKAIFALYKERGIHPFASFFLVLVQSPILIGLYWVFSRGGLPIVVVARLYSFVHIPAAINMEFLGLQNMAGHSIVLALLAGLTQFVYTRLAMGPRGVKTATEASFSDDMAKSLDVQARFVLPAVISVIAYTVVAAAPLYWVASNSFMIVQEYAAGRRFKGDLT
ncbi:MAG TPA: YidC/Oxa1 family membrane protein insertase [Candidatus Paceibacterota bacterium]|nr:YidC/Oxa1 family membrane protein insertase [Candidatus Paceibacterota bacterium]